MTAMTGDPRDYRLDVSGVGAGQETGEGQRQAGSAGPRPFLSVLFACCGVYQRVYRDATGKHYEGRCPRCRRAVRFEVGKGGTTARSFIAR